MNILAEKLDIIELVTRTDDIVILRSVKELLEDDFSHDHWENLNTEQKARIKQAMESGKSGKLTPTKEVMATFRKQFEGGTL